MSLLRNRTYLQTRDDVDSDDERTPSAIDENVLFRTTGRAFRSKKLVGKQVLNPFLTRDRREKAQYALTAVRSAGDRLEVIKLLDSLASSTVTDIIPPGATSQEVAESDDIPPATTIATVDGPTARNQKPIKRNKLFGRAKSRPTTLADIKKFMPIQFGFPPHPEGDRSNDWFQNSYAVLFDRIFVFAKEYFGFQKLEKGFHEPWAIDMPVEFLRYVELVAEPDPAVGGWDELLTNTDSRVFVIIAVIVRILEVKVFAPNLWGNTKEGEEFLHGLDRALLDSEGYSRQELRSKSIRTLLGGASVTPNFHSDCSTLTAQMMLLFAPLFNHLTLLPAGPEIIIPLPTDLYQHLHNIIASAAYLSICIRVSPTILHIAHLVPGTPYLPDEHTSVHEGSWTLSKVVVQENWKKEHARLELERAQAEGYKDGYKRAGRLDSKSGQQAISRYETAQQDFANHKPPGYTHRACVKIAVWPITRRYWAGNGKPGGEWDGQSVYTVTNAGAVFYQKNTDRAIDPLLEFVADKKKKIRGKVKKFRDAMTLLSLLFLGTLLISAYFISLKEIANWPNRAISSTTDALRSRMEGGGEMAHWTHKALGIGGSEWLSQARENLQGRVSVNLKERYSKASDAAKSEAGRLYGEYKGKASSARNKVESGYSGARDQAGSIYSSATDKAGSKVSSFREKSARGRGD